MLNFGDCWKLPFYIQSSLVICRREEKKEANFILILTLSPCLLWVKERIKSPPSGEGLYKYPGECIKEHIQDPRSPLLQETGEGAYPEVPSCRRRSIPRSLLLHSASQPGTEWPGRTSPDRPGPLLINTDISRIAVLELWTKHSRMKVLASLVLASCLVYTGNCLSLFRKENFFCNLKDDIINYSKIEAWLSCKSDLGNEGHKKLSKRAVFWKKSEIVRIYYFTWLSDLGAKKLNIAKSYELLSAL